MDLRTKWDGKNHKLETSIYTVHFVCGLKVQWVMYVEGISEIRVSDVLVGKYERQTEHKHAAGRTVLKCDVFHCEI